MADNISLQSNEDIPLGCLSTNPLPPQPPGLPKPSPTVTASPNGAVPQTFHRFSQLPPELRIAIWELSLPHRVHTFPRPSRKFDFKHHIWCQQEIHGVKAEKQPSIALVCYEAFDVALASGSAKKIWFRRPWGNKLSRVWVDPKRDTAVIKLDQLSSRSSTGLYTQFKYGHLYSTIGKQEMHIALDSSWALCFCTISPGQARRFYYDLIHGHKECDFVVLDLQLDVTNEEAAGTGLFSSLRSTDSVLIPIEDTRQMSRLFVAQAKFNTVNWLNKWEDFTQFRKPTNLDEFIQRWKKLAAREMRNVQRGLDFLTCVEFGRRGQDVGERREQVARAAAIKAKHPKFRPVIMVSRGVEN